MTNLLEIRVRQTFNIEFNSLNYEPVKNLAKMLSLPEVSFGVIYGSFARGYPDLAFSDLDDIIVLKDTKFNDEKLELEWMSKNIKKILSIHDETLGSIQSNKDVLILTESEFKDYMLPYLSRFAEPIKKNVFVPFIGTVPKAVLPSYNLIDLQKDALLNMEKFLDDLMHPEAVIPNEKMDYWVTKRALFFLNLYEIVLAGKLTHKLPLIFADFEKFGKVWQPVKELMFYTLANKELPKYEGGSEYKAYLIYAMESTLKSIKGFLELSEEYISTKEKMNKIARTAYRMRKAFALFEKTSEGISLAMTTGDGRGYAFNAYSYEKFFNTFLGYLSPEQINFVSEMDGEMMYSQEPLRIFSHGKLVKNINDLKTYYSSVYMPAIFSFLKWFRKTNFRDMYESTLT